LRVPASSLDRLLDRVRSLEQAETSLAAVGRELASIAMRARRIRSALSLAAGALDFSPRALAGARIREASSSVAGLSDALEREAATLLGVAERAREGARAAHDDIARMRTTTAGSLFDRVVSAAAVQARRASRNVHVSVRGGETPVDRRIAEDLLDPLLQLAQNAIVHGIEPPHDRVLRNKPPAGTVSLSAELRGTSLVLVISDDGAGVDVEAVRGRARSRGTLSAARAVSADEQALLGLLFVPGFTTRESADMLAGRGVGLGLVRAAVRRLGGSVRISSRPGLGFSATIEVPIERGVVRVLWVRAGGATYALPARLVHRVHVGTDVEAAFAEREIALPLAACVRGLGAIVSGEALGSSDVPSYVLELDPGREDGASFFVSVDAVGDIDEAALHTPPPLIAQAGPYIGAIVQTDTVRLCLDVFALGELVHLVHGRR
jgi:chemotaxis protein histidine kinase CheA